MLRQLRDKEASATLLHMGLFEDEWHCLAWRGLYAVLFAATKGLTQRSHSEKPEKVI